MSRSVIVGEREYIIELLASTRLHYERLGSWRYVQVELPGAWKAVFGAPPGVDDLSHVWYRELIEFVHEAERVVASRATDRGAHAAD